MTAPGEESRKQASRRQHPRRAAAGITCICYRTQSGVMTRPRQNIGEEIVDVSWGGARIRVGERVAKGDPVTMELRDSASGEVFRARGDVRWCEDRKTEIGSTHYIGVQFTEIYSPVERRDQVLLGTSPLELKSAGKSGGAGEKAGQEQRQAARFLIDDYIVTCFKQGALSTIGLRKNVAREVANISRTGVQILSSEILDTAGKVLLTVHLNKFGDTLEAEGTVKWSRREPHLSSHVFRVGVEFAGMTNEKRKLIDFMMKWFADYQAKHKN